MMILGGRLVPGTSCCFVHIVSPVLPSYFEKLKSCPPDVCVAVITGLLSGPIKTFSLKVLATLHTAGRSDAIAFWPFNNSDKQTAITATSENLNGRI